MKAPSLLLVALIAITFAGVAQAGPGPTSPLYLTYTYGLNGGHDIVVVQGSTITSFPEAYNAPHEFPIAVWGDVRTAGVCCGGPGGQYTLGGVPTGTSYSLPTTIVQAYDSTSDGSHNYLVDFDNGTVYQTARDFTNSVALFTSVGSSNAGITYDAANESLWISGWASFTTVADYSLNGVLLSSFSTGHFFNEALALDPADHTLWLANGANGTDLEQYSTAGVLLSSGYVGGYVGFAFGGEFDLGPATAAPEPATLILFGSGILGLVGVLRRKINL